LSQDGTLLSFAERREHQRTSNGGDVRTENWCDEQRRTDEELLRVAEEALIVGELEEESLHRRDR